MSKALAGQIAARSAFLNRAQQQQTYAVVGCGKALRQIGDVRVEAEETARRRLGGCSCTLGDQLAHLRDGPQIEKLGVRKAKCRSQAGRRVGVDGQHGPARLRKVMRKQCRDRGFTDAALSGHCYLHAYSLEPIRF